MGCFNVAGTMSNLSLGHGRKVVFIPLLKSGYSREKIENVEIETTTMLTSNEASSVLYSPIFLPIKGEYNDYGSLENIERDANVEYIEEYFGITIDEFMEQVSRNFCGEENVEVLTEEKQKLIEGISGMFESRDVYEDMVTYSKEKNSAYLKSNLSTKILEMLGFQLNTEKSTGDKRYNKYYEHPEIKDVAIYSDGTYVEVINLRNNLKIHYTYSVQKLEEELKNKMDINLEDFCDLSELKNHCVSYYKVTNAVQTKQTEKNRLKEIKKEKEELLSLKEKGLSEEQEKKLSDLDFEQYKIEDRMFFEEHFGIYQFRNWNSLKNYTLKKEHSEDLIKFLNFDFMMYATNNYYAPAMNGEQHGNLEASEALYKSCMKFVELEKSYYDE